MKKIFVLALTIASMLFVLLLVGLAGANPHPLPGFPEISASYSPDLVSNTVTLNVSISMLQDRDSCTRQAWYSLDGQKKVVIPLTYKGTSYWGIYNFSEVTGETKLSMWLDGPHILTVTVIYDYGGFIRNGSTTLFIGQPEPTPGTLNFNIISPQNQAVYSNQVPIVYSINSNVSYSYYALDNPDSTTKGWTSFEGNITLTGLSAGSHNITLFVSPEDKSLSTGYAEETVYFNVDSSTASSVSSVAPTPTVTEVTFFVIFSLMLVIFFIALSSKRKHV
jgi:uncharacterized protein YaaQ